MADAFHLSPQDALSLFRILVQAAQDNVGKQQSRALRYATMIATNMAPAPDAGPSGAVAKTKRLLDYRKADTALTPWDEKAVLNAYIQALSIPEHTPLSETTDVRVVMFNTAYALLRAEWEKTPT